MQEGPPSIDARASRRHGHGVRVDARRDSTRHRRGKTKNRNGEDKDSAHRLARITQDMSIRESIVGG